MYEFAYMLRTKYIDKVSSRYIGLMCMYVRICLCTCVIACVCLSFCACMWRVLFTFA